MQKKCQNCGQLIPEGNWAENWCDPCIDQWTATHSEQEIKNVLEQEQFDQEEESVNM